MNDRLLYIALISVQSLAAFIGCVTILTSRFNLGMAFVALSLAILPFASHLRMRRSLNAIKHVIQSGNFDEVYAAFNDRRGTLDSKLAELSDSTQLLSSRLSDTTDVQDLNNAINALRREARMLRLVSSEAQKSIPRTN
ncbi:hypothetical protein BJP06_07900 [Corynebacterium sp. NML120713]|nr:hypothetical protein BJP06_07900 [Corynebacterium sp. NML120713]